MLAWDLMLYRCLSVPIVEVNFQLFSLSSGQMAPGLAVNKVIAKDLVDHIRKFIGALENPIFKLERAAEWLENWIGGHLPDYELLDVSASLDNFFLDSHVLSSC